jgi:hypothetical protein
MKLFLLHFVQRKTFLFITEGTEETFFITEGTEETGMDIIFSILFHYNKERKKSNNLVIFVTIL